MILIFLRLKTSKYAIKYAVKIYASIQFKKLVIAHN